MKKQKRPAVIKAKKARYPTPAAKGAKVKAAATNCGSCSNCSGSCGQGCSSCHS